MSSAGLRVLIATTIKLQGQGGLILCSMNEQVREVFEMTGLAGLVFKVLDSKEEALAEF